MFMVSNYLLVCKICETFREGFPQFDFHFEFSLQLHDLQKPLFVNHEAAYWLLFFNIEL